MHLLQRQKTTEAVSYWHHLVFLRKVLLNLLLSGCFLWSIKIFTQLVIISQALSTPTLVGPKIRSQVLFWNISVLHIKVEQKWRNIHQCDKRNRQNGNGTLVICYPGHLKPLIEMWRKNFPSLLQVSTLFRKHWGRSPVDSHSYPLMQVCIFGHLMAQTMWLYKTYRNSAKALLWTHKLYQTNLGWNTEQLKITAQESQDRTIAP